MSKKINFDISCFKEEFQNYIFENLSLKNYYDFINTYKNDFHINIECHNCSENIPNLESEINVLTIDEDCSFNDIKPDEKIEEKIEKLISDETTDNIEQEKTESDYEYSSESETEDINLEQNITYVIENSNIIVKSDKKFMNKKNAKKFKKNGGKWMKKNNQWIFPISKKNFIDSIIQKKQSESFIQEIKQENNRVIIIPTQNHPKYGTSIIYDKSDNIGIWQNNIKGWVFDKKI